MDRLIIKTWVCGFYKTYAGFLFVLFLLFFGFIRGQEHLAIAQFLVYDTANLIYPAAVFLIYAALLVFYTRHFFLNPRNRFLSDLVYLSANQRLKTLWRGVHWLLLPATIYGIFLLVIAILTGMLTSIILVLIFFIILNVTLTCLFDRMLIRPGEKIYGFTSGFSFSLGGKWSFSTFLIKHLILCRSLPFIMTKLLSMLNLFFFSILIPTVDYLDRFLGIAIFTAILSNGLLPYEMFHFSLRKMTFLRNLPIGRSFIFLQIWMTMGVLLLPEIFYIYRNFMNYVKLDFLTIHLLAAVSLLIFLFSSQLVFRLDQKNFTSSILGILLFIVFYLLFDLPATFLLILLLFSSYYLFYHYFYRYESEYKMQSV
jgi:hypothetical protein